MKVKMILPALTEAKSPYFRPIKYSLFPPLGLATLAAYLRDDDQVNIQDEHVETLDLDDQPDLVVIQVYITSAYRAYRLADHYRARRRAASDNAQRLGNEAVKVGSRIGHDALDRLSVSVERRPIATLAVAVGLGILIGSAGRWRV